MDIFNSFAFWVDTGMMAWDDGQLADIFPINSTEFKIFQHGGPRVGETILRLE